MLVGEYVPEAGPPGAEEDRIDARDRGWLVLLAAFPAGTAFVLVREVLALVA